MSTVNLALAGNPNSGKTTFFNLLTGARQHVGNYPGITVERKEGHLSWNNGQVRVLDLPGCYSLTSYSPEEVVARNALLKERPQAVVQVVDANTLERSLFLTVQFLELGIPVVLALNMMDEARRKGLRIDSAKLSALLGLPVVETVAREGQGKEALVAQAVAHAREKLGRTEPLALSYGKDLDPILTDMAAIVERNAFLIGRYPARWIALKYLEGDAEVMREGEKSDSQAAKALEAKVAEARKLCRDFLKSYPEAVIADFRYGYINSILQQGVVSQDARRQRIEISERLDQVLTHRLLGPGIMLAVLYAVFYATFSIGEIPMGWLEALFGYLGETAENLIPEGLFRSLVVSGVIDGVGGVLGFVPLIVVMFFALTLLEDSGYMARVAYMLDRVLRVFGLHGCSVMPFLVSGGLPGGCAVPGIMATRTLRNPKEKLATLLTAPFMTCGAKVPVFILLAAAFFPGLEARVMFLSTLGAWAMALLASRLLRSTLLKGESTPFVMELPPYRMPTLRGLVIHTWERTWQYIKKAGTVILAISILIWAAMTFPGLPQEQAAGFEALRLAAQQEGSAQAELDDRLTGIDNQEAQAALRHSVAGRIGVFLEPISRWAGFDWRTNISLVGGFAAKEVIVSALGTAYSLGDVDPEESETLSQRLAGDRAWSFATALSLIVFVLLYAPCFVTVVAMARESSWGWALFSVGFSTALAFFMAVAVYQVSSALA
ncbi:MAG: ferrous iron transport protein B [Desulfovibrionaceae bacterium]|nr:ferrous iron transport protein B [Desulfovibrionaceae bacterium]